MISNTFSGSTSTSTITDRQFKVAPGSFGDSIACLTWTKDENPNLLLCSAWDGYVTIYKVHSTDAEVSTVGEVSQAHSMLFDTPILSVAWQSATKNVIAGSVDGSVNVKDPNATESSSTKIGQHDDAVKGVYYLEETNTICSVSYDKTMKFWDLRSSGPTSSLNLGAKVLCSDMLFPTIAMGLSDGMLLIFDVVRDFESVTRHVENHYIDCPIITNTPLSAISISEDNTIGIGTCDGRSNISKYYPSVSSAGPGLDSFVTFQAHKIGPGENGNTSNLPILYPIHAVGLHPRQRHTYFTAGGDGCVNFWKIRNVNKLASFTCSNTPITAAKYSPNGKLLAYAYGYDWAKGIEGSKSIQPKLHIHSTQLDEVARESVFSIFS